MLRVQSVWHSPTQVRESLEMTATRTPRYVHIHHFFAGRVFTYYMPKAIWSIAVLSDYPICISNPNLDVQTVSNQMFNRASGRRRKGEEPAARRRLGVQKFCFGRDSFAVPPLRAPYGENTARTNLSRRNKLAWRVCYLPVNVWYPIVCLLVRYPAIVKAVR